MAENFETIFCTKYGVRPEHFAQSLLSKSCHWQARPLLKLILLINPGEFAQDLRHLETLRGSTNRQAFSLELTSIETFNQYNIPTWRRILQLRVSVGKLSQLSKLLE